MGIYEQIIQDKSNRKTLPERCLEMPRETLYLERDELFLHCSEIQKKVLEEILECAQGSAYAKNHQFDGIKEIEKWRERCPISEYEDYVPYIESEMNGNNQQLYNRETKMVVATTGSTGKTKLFLESEAGNAAKLLVMVIRGMIMGDLLPVTRDYNAKNLTISNYSNLGTTPSGHTIVRASGQTARNLRRKAGPMNILTVPFWEIEGLDQKDREYAIGVLALSDERMSKIFCNNLVAFGRILDLIENNAQQMINDIRKGTFSLNVSIDVKTQLEHLVSKNEERANVLQKIFNTKGVLFSCPADILDVWPNLQMASCWMSGSVGRDAYDVIQRLPQNMQYFDMGYGASEGKFNLPIKLGNPSGVVAVFSAFFEFIPIKGKRKPLCLWEIENGEYYELLVTTYSGLYRYRMLDIVRVEGVTGNTPNMVFCGKSTEHIKVDEEIIYGYQFADIVRYIEKNQQIDLDLVQVYFEDNKLFYIISSKYEFDYHRFYEELNQLLEEKWEIICSGIYFVKASYKKRLFDQRVLKDRGACGIKLPIIVKELPMEAEQILKISKVDWF